MPETWKWTFPIAGAFIALYVIIGEAVAHSDMAMNYPVRCCSGDAVGGDCAPLEGVGAVDRRDDGWFIPLTGETIPFSKAEPSQDMRFHRCVRPDGTTRCFFAPGSGT